MLGLSLNNIELFLDRLAGIILTVLLIVFSLWNPTFLNELRLKSFDVLVRNNPAPMGKTPVVIVDIDLESLANHGQWPWPRNLIADLLTRITESDPYVVGIDILFAEPDRSSPRHLITNAGLNNVPTEVQEYLKKLPDHDFALARSLYYSPVPIIIGHAFTNDKTSARKWFPRAGKFAILGEDPSPFLFHFNQVDANLEMFEKTAKGSGFFNILPDSDGIARDEPLLISFNQELYPSLVLKMLQVVAKVDTMVVKTDQNGVRAVQVGQYRIPTNGNGKFIVNYSGPGYSFTYLSAHTILNNSFDPTILKYAYVLLGTSAIGLHDIQAVPTDPVFPRVEIHANALNTVLSKNYLIRPEWSKGAEVVYLLFTGLLLILFLPRMNAIKGGFYTLLLIGSMVVFSLWNFYYNHLLIDIVYPIFTTGLLFTSLTFLNFIAEEKKARRIRSSFSQYLSPILVEELVENQKSLSLGGDERELTILFSDIRSFTTLAEDMSPRDLCTFLNLITTKVQLEKKTSKVLTL